MEQLVGLENLIVRAEREFETACQKTHFYRVELKPGQPVLIHPMLCKARRCEQCGFYWAWKWRLALRDKKDTLERQGSPNISRAITLTTAYDCGYEKMWMALKYFWRYLRRYSPDFTRPFSKGRKKLKHGVKQARFPYAMLQYWGVVEENQEHTQPHLHFIIYNPSDDKKSYIPKELIKRAWQEAQKEAGFEKIAWDTRIEKIKSDVSRYFTKYLTKLTGGKDEIPLESWGGRFVRYSVASKIRPGFFSVGVGAITAAHGLAKYFQDPTEERSYCLIAQNVGLDEFIEIAKGEANTLNAIIKSGWDWQADKIRAEVWKEEMFPEYITEKAPKIVTIRERPPKPQKSIFSSGFMWFLDQYQAKRGFASLT
jgi:hypothetical protein